VKKSFPLARKSAQIEKFVTKELKKLNFGDNVTIARTDPSPDIAQFLQKSWKTEGFIDMDITGAPKRQALWNANS